MKVNTAALSVLREKQGLTQKRLAREVDVSASMISLIENGKRNPSPKIGKRIANTLEVPMEAIFFFHDLDECQGK